MFGLYCNDVEAKNVVNFGTDVDNVDTDVANNVDLS